MDTDETQMGFQRVDGGANMPAVLGTLRDYNKFNHGAHGVHGEGFRPVTSVISARAVVSSLGKLNGGC